MPLKEREDAQSRERYPFMSHLEGLSWVHAKYKASLGDKPLNKLENKGFHLKLVDYPLEQ
jgi:hypothetical protein